MLSDAQRRNGLVSTVKAALMGDDPLTTSSPDNQFTHPTIEAARRAFLLEKLEREVGEVLKTSEWGTVQEWFRTVEEGYRKQNESLLELQHPNMTQEEVLELQKRLQPLQVDPNEVAEMRQVMTGVNQQMMDVSGGKLNLWNHPSTKRIATFMNRETAIGTPGFLRSGGQELPAFTEYVARPAVEGLSGLMDPIGQAVFGGIGWIGEGLSAISGGNLGWEAPTNFVELPDGTVQTNAGRLPGMLDMFVALHAMGTNQDVGKAVANFEAAREHGQANSSGFGELLTGVAQVTGTLAAFAPTAAAGVAITGNINKGLRYLGVLGKVSKGGQATMRAKNIMRLTAATGQASAFAMQEAITSGAPEKFLEALKHGGSTGLVMHALGSMGKSVELFAKRRGMPAKVATGLAVASEALGFTALEFADMKGSMWEFIKDPTDQSWETYSLTFTKNFVAMLLFRGLGGRLGEGPRPVDLTEGIRATQKMIGEQLQGLKATGEKIPQALRRQIEKMGAKPEQLEQLRELSERAQAGDAKAGAEMAQLERTLRAQEAGAGRGEAEDIQAEVGRLGRATAESLAAQGPTPAARGEVIQRLRGARGQLTERAMEMVTRSREGLGPFTRAERTTGTFQRVVGKEPGPIREEGAKAEAKRRAAAEKRAQEALDPLEDPAFKKLPKEQQQAILKGRTPEERKRIVRAETTPILGSFRQHYEVLREPVKPGEALTEPARKSDIFAKMQGFEGDPVRTPQRKGGISGRPGMTRSVKGFLDRNENLIRIRGDYELAERAHEFSHSIQEAAIGIEGKALPPEAKAEARQMLEGYAGADKLSAEILYAEAWAEYHARDLLGERGMAEQFPQLAKIFAPALASRPAVLQQFGEVKGLFERYRGQGDYERARMFIHALGDKPSPEARAAFRAEEGGLFRRAVRRANEWLFQDVERLSTSLQKWTKIAGVDPSLIPISMHITRTIETLRGTEAAKAASFMQEGVLRMRRGELERGQSLKNALETVKTPDQKEALMVYLATRKMWEMQKKGIPTFFPKDSILRAMDEAASRFGGLVQAERVSRKIKAFFDDLVGWTADEGLMTREEADSMIEAWSTYTPFQRYYERALRSGEQFTGGGLRRIKGGTEEIADPFEAMVQVATGIVRQVHRHKSLDALYQMGKKFKGLGGLVTQVPPNQLPKEFRVDEILKAIEKQVELPGDRQQELEYSLDLMREVLGEDAAASLMLFRPSYQVNKNRPILLHRTKGGKRVWLEVDKGAYEAIQAVENTLPAIRAVATLESLGRTLRIPTGIVRFFATGINLEFAARNTFRDAALFPGYSNVPRSLLPWSGLAYWARGVKRVLTGDKDPKLAEINSVFRAMGGEALSFFSREIRRKKGSEQLLPKEARTPEEFTPRGMLNKARDFLESTVGKVVDVGERALRFEEFTEVYKRATKEGKSHSEAAMEALEASKEVTINFTRAGILSRQLNQIIPYFNASMQGMRKTFRAFSGADGERAMKVAWANFGSTLAVTTALQHWWHADEKWFKDLAPWQRFLSWHFKVGEDFIEIPKPHLPGWAVTSVFDQLFAENKMDAGDVLGELKDQLVMDHLALPSFALPFIEWAANYSFWKERLLVPNWLERSRVPSEQYDSYTTGWAKWMSKVAADTFGVEFSPIKLQNFANQASGSLPSQLERYIGGIGNMLGFELDPDRKETLDQIPILSSMLRHHAHRGSRAVRDFYEIRGDLERLRSSGKITPTQQPKLEEAHTLRDRLNDIRNLREQGTLSREEADRMSYEVVAPFVKRERGR